MVLLLFSGCTCSEEEAPVAPPPAAPIAANTPTAVVPTEPSAAGAAGQESPVPPASPTMDSSAQRTVCDGYVAAIARQDAARLESPELRAFAVTAPDLVACAAVAADSDALCDKLLPVETGPTMMCKHTRAIFHELRHHPNTRSFMFNEIDWKGCRGVPGVPATVCDGIRDALRAGNAEDCVKAGDGKSLCLAYMAADASLCRVEGQLLTAEFKFPDPKEGEPAIIKIKDAAEETCRKAIESRSFLSQGLQSLAASGPPRERALAKAALGDAAACSELAKSAVEACTMSLAVKASAVEPATAAAGEKKDAGQPGEAQGGPK
jgi:hypothetical protein